MAKTLPSQGTGMAKSLPSQRFWDTIEMLRITKGENIAENDTKKYMKPDQTDTFGYFRETLHVNA